MSNISDEDLAKLRKKKGDGPDGLETDEEFIERMNKMGYSIDKSDMPRWKQLTNNGKDYSGGASDFAKTKGGRQ